jgi:hypothetical protein
VCSLLRGKKGDLVARGFEDGTYGADESAMALVT